MSEYPKMLYDADGRTTIVNDESEERAADGFSNDPSSFYALTPGYVTREPTIDPPAGPASDTAVTQDPARAVRSKQKDV